MGRWIDGEGHYQRLRWKFRLPTTPCGAAVPLRLQRAIDRARIELQTRLSIYTCHIPVRTPETLPCPPNRLEVAERWWEHTSPAWWPQIPHGISSLTMAAIGGSCVHDRGVIPTIYVPDGGWGNRPPAWSSARRARWFMLGRTVLSGEAHSTEGIPLRHLGIRDRDRRVGPISSDKGKRARLCWWERWAAWRWVGPEWETRPTRRFVFSFSIFWFFSFLFQIQIKPQV
jgi:hypothetical protein